MKTRLKTKNEKDYDQFKLDLSKNDLSEEAIFFMSEFIEHDGDVFYSSYRKFSNKVWEYETEKQSARCSKVGETFDWENKVCGEYRYRDI